MSWKLSTGPGRLWGHGSTHSPFEQKVTLEPRILSLEYHLAICLLLLTVPDSDCFLDLEWCHQGIRRGRLTLGDERRRTPVLRVFSLVVSYRETAVIELKKPVSDRARLCQQLGTCTKSRTAEF